MDSRDQGRVNGLIFFRNTTESGDARLSASVRRFVPKHVDPAGAIQQYKLTAAMEWMKSFVLPARSEVTDGQSH